MFELIYSKRFIRSYHLFLLEALEISIFRKRIDGRRKFEEERMKKCFERFVKKRVLIIFFFSEHSKFLFFENDKWKEKV